MDLNSIMLLLEKNPQLREALKNRALLSTLRDDIGLNKSLREQFVFDTINRNVKDLVEKPERDILESSQQNRDYNFNNSNLPMKGKYDRLPLHLDSLFNRFPRQF